MACIADQGHCAWPFNTKGGGECPDADNGSQIPQTIVGDNTGLFDDYVPSCSPLGGGEDALHQFTAPNAGTYTFTISESDSDTALFILDGCGGEEIACNQDIDFQGLNWLSEVEIELAADQTVIVGIDSWNGEVGPYTLTIAEN